VSKETTMRDLTKFAAAAIASLGLAAASSPAGAQTYDDGHPQDHPHYHHHHRRADYHDCRAGQRHDATVGTVVGAIGGGLIGNAVGHGRPVGTLLGAGAGAYAGHEIAKSNHPC